MMPFLILAAGIVFVVVAIAALKIHPFIALLLAAVLVGVLTPAAEQAALGDRAVAAVHAAVGHFGETVGAVGIVIVLAALIGQCLLDSGAADRITRTLLALLGEKRAAGAFLGSGYLLSVPVFFDTVFFLLIPLARSLYRRTRKNYALYVMAICAGAVVTHSLAPPTPGPLIMVETLPGLNLGTALVLGGLLGLAPAAAGLLYAGWLNSRLSFREASPGGQESPLPQTVASELPGLTVSLLPVVLPVFLIAGDTMLRSLRDAAGLQLSTDLLGWAAFLGDRNVALLLGALAAMTTLKRRRGLSLLQLRERLEPAMMTGGMIVLITSAGGAFGKALSETGISRALQESGGGSADGSGIFYLLLAWAAAAVLKTAQGSGTVSIITASGIMAGVIGDARLPYHPIYVFGAVGFGSMVVSWMNDSGFWVVGKMSGFNERQTFQTWSLLLVVIALAGLLEVLLLSAILPLR